MKRPSFQFYPGDWQANSNLRRCTHAEKGAWLDVMCLMHDQPEYGQLRWPLKEIAQAIGATPALLKGLVTKGVIKGDDKEIVEPFVYTPRSGRKDGEPVVLVPTQPGPLWYSSRMVRDEYVRTVRGDGTRFGDPDGADPKAARKPSPKPPLGDGPSSSSSSPSSPSENKDPSHSTDVGGGGADDVHPAAQPTQAGAICRAMRQAGVADVNPGHPRLLSLIAAGATAEEFLAFVGTATDGSKGSPFAYVLGAVEGERKRAARTAPTLHHGAMPTAGASGDRKARQLATAAVLTGAAQPPRSSPETIDVDARIVAP